MSGKMYYQCCSVPNCRNTTITAPTKLYIHVPANPTIRQKWLELAKIDQSHVSPKSNLFFCEDHFDLPNDMANYMQYHLMGSVKRIIMKPMCLPSKFECQDYSLGKRKTTQPNEDSQRRKNLVEELLRSESNLTNEPAEQEAIPGTSRDRLDQDISYVHCEPKSVNKSVQVYIPKHYRSKSSQTTFQRRNSVTSPIKIATTTIAISPFKKMAPSKSGASRKLTFVDEDTSGSEYMPSMPESSPSQKHTSDNSDLNEEEIKAAQEVQKELNLKYTLNKIKNKPRFYIGLPKHLYYLVEIIEKHSSIPEKFILLCLKKIRLNTKFEELADEFSITKSYASKIFLKNIPIIAEFLLPFIGKLNPVSINLNLPIAFRHKYYKVSCIIDCLEIEIEKPSKAINQSFTWSQYKKCNTIKYLISCTPDGLVNYISPGYGGRVSDLELIEDCDFLDGLPVNTYILADRGFKHLEPLLSSKGLHLLRPPSVSGGSKLTKDEVKKTKQIASLRIHVERVIRRLREFVFLKPHAVTNSKLIDCLDECITIACALVNLQDSLIKK